MWTTLCLGFGVYALTFEMLSFFVMKWSATISKIRWDGDNPITPIFGVVVQRQVVVVRLIGRRWCYGLFDVVFGCAGSWA